jgi:hypothetical protein
MKRERLTEIHPDIGTILYWKRATFEVSASWLGLFIVSGMGRQGRWVPASDVAAYELVDPLLAVAKAWFSALSAAPTQPISADDEERIYQEARARLRTRVA